MWYDTWWAKRIGNRLLPNDALAIGELKKKEYRIMVQMMIEMPESALAALRKTPEDFARELRLAAAVKWYELRQLSQERAANIAGVSRAEFLDSLGRFGVSPFQYDADDIVEEANRA